VDWQFVSSGGPFLDIGTTAIISASPEKTQEALPIMLEAYMTKFKTICKSKNVESPSFLKDMTTFTEEVLTRATRAAFMWCSTSYELVHKYPNLEQRVKWALRESVKRSPELYQ